MALSSGPRLGLLVNGNLGEAHYTELMRFFRGVDFLTQLTVLDRDLATPPGSPADGAAYIVAASPTGAWGGHAGHLARWSSVLTAWEFFTPQTGWRCWVADEAIELKFYSGVWNT